MCVYVCMYIYIYIYIYIYTYIHTCSICIMSTWGVSDLSRVPRASRQMACIPNLLGRRIRIFTTTIDTLTPLL